MKSETYTPTNFRKNAYPLFRKVGSNKETVRITMNNKHKLANSNVLLINEKTYLKLLHEYRGMKDRLLLEKNGELKDTLNQMKNEKPGDFDRRNAY